MEHLLCFLYVFVIGKSFAATTAAGILPAEQEAAYHALESINSAVEWRALYPDDMCLAGPHGVVCDLFPDGDGGFTPHITELNFGYLSDFNSNPECGINASLPSLLSSSSLPFLRRLFFYRCFRSSQTAISAGFWNISPSLEELVIHENPALVGLLSPLIAGLVKLRRLIISGTRISGMIPSEIGQLRGLEQLVLSRNLLEGVIPTAVGSVPWLKVLDLSSNHLVGGIPHEIGRLTQLVKLDLSWNQLTGLVPVEFAQLKRLEFLDLSHNRFIGGVPTSLAEMRSLKEIYLNDNPLGGRIPEIWGNLGITGLGLSGLGLIGNIPPSIGSALQNICYLSLERNFLVGELPEQIQLLERSAKEINIEKNALHGRIPFSARFIALIGDKLKLGGNPKLCFDEDVVAYVKGKGNFGNVQVCNKTEITSSALFSLYSFSPSVVSRHLTVCFFLLSLFIIVC